MTKTVSTDNKTALIAKIRDTRDERIKLQKPCLKESDGRVTVLALSSGNWTIGEVRTKSALESKRLVSSTSVELTVGWDKNRHREVCANFYNE